MTNKIERIEPAIAGRSPKRKSTWYVIGILAIRIALVTAAYYLLRVESVMNYDILVLASRALGGAILTEFFWNLFSLYRGDTYE